MPTADVTLPSKFADIQGQHRVRIRDLKSRRLRGTIEVAGKSVIMLKTGEVLGTIGPRTRVVGAKQGQPT